MFISVFPSHFYSTVWNTGRKGGESWLCRCSKATLTNILRNIHHSIQKYYTRDQMCTTVTDMFGCAFGIAQCIQDVHSLLHRNYSNQKIHTKHSSQTCSHVTFNNILAAATAKRIKGYFEAISRGILDYCTLWKMLVSQTVQAWCGMCSDMVIWFSGFLS